MDIIVSGVAQRSGSTLVQRIFNARKQTLVWGEHGGILSDFVKIGVMARHFSRYGKAEREAYFRSGEDPNTWIANMSPDEERIDEGVVHAVKACLGAMYADFRDSHDRIGFKEVRYGKREIELLKKCFPDAVIVLLVRHPVQIWKSETSYWSGDARQFGLVWNERALEYAELHDPGCGIYLLRYEDIVSREEPALDLLSALAGVARGEIDKVLAVNLNSTSTARSERDMESIRSSCKKGMRRLGYAD